MYLRVVWTIAAAALVAAIGVPVDARDPEIRALWVDSFNPGLRSPAEIDALIERMKRGRLNTVIAQVRRNAQSLFADSREGWIEGYTPPAGFDPLRDLIAKAHAARFEVHAWVNIGPVYSGHPQIATASWPCAVPCDVNHVFNRHGWGTSGDDYWLTRTHPAYTGGTLSPFPGERVEAGTWWMDLGHPAAAEHTLNALLHLVEKYDVDGLHLDYIRYPEMPVLPASAPVRLAFSTGYNPVSVRRFNAAHGRPVDGLPDPWDASWSDWRRTQVRAFVRRLYLETLFRKPDITLSAALITFFRGPNAAEPRTFEQTEAYYRVFQDWNGWMREGILDWAIPMIYKSEHLATHRVQFAEWVEFTKTQQYARHGVIGLGAYMNSLENTIVQMAAGRAEAGDDRSRARGFTFFSYNATNGDIPDLPARPRDEFFRAVADSGAYARGAPFQTHAAMPERTWKTDPRRGFLLAQIADADGRPADGAQVTIARVGGRLLDEGIVQFADGNGYVGGVDLEPGAYQLTVSLPTGVQVVPVPEPVREGRVTRTHVTLRLRARGPFVRLEPMRSLRERIDHLPAAASPLDEWRRRDPVPDDLRPRGPRPPQQ